MSNTSIPFLDDVLSTD